MEHEGPVGMAKGIRAEIEGLNKELEGKWFGKEKARGKLIDGIADGTVPITPIPEVTAEMLETEPPQREETIGRV